MSKIDISIIVPIYNSEKNLKRCIDSLINQTKKELEFILVNDGSTDSSEEIIKNYDDKRIKYYKNKNQGIGKSRNFGIDKSIGKYIMFIDSDDYVDLKICEKLFDKAEKDNLDLVVCDFYRVFNNKERVNEKISFFENTSLKDNPNLINIINLSPWNKLYKSSLLQNNKIRFEEKLKYEDAPFVCSAIYKSNKIGKLNESLLYYVIHENSETTIRDKKCFDIIKIVDIIRNMFKNESFIKENIDMLTVRILTNYTIQQRVQIDRTIAMNFIDEVFKYLEKEIPDYKNNKYYKDRGILKRTIEKNKLLTKIYCKLYRK